MRPDVQNGTHALLERIYRSELGASLRSRMRRRHFSCSPEEIADAWQEACAIAARACSGKHEGEVFRYLEITMHNLLMDAAQRARVERGLPTLEAPAGAQAGLEERASKQELATLVLELVACLPERQQQVFILHSHGLRKPVIAARLGATRRAVARDIETGFKRLRKGLVERVGGGCGGPEEDLVARYAFGLATGDQLARAQGHLLACAACQDLYARLDAWREAAAAVVPAPAAEQIEPGMLERVAGRFGDGLAALKQHVTDGAATTKQQATGLWYRSVDPTPLSGARPGAAVAAIAGCLAIGGGATYCLDQGVNPLDQIGSLVDRQPAEERPDPRREQAENPPPPNPVPPPSTTAPATPEPQQVTPPPTESPPPVPPAPEDEYEPTTAGAQATASPREPAPARPGGIGDFQGP